MDIHIYVYILISLFTFYLIGHCTLFLARIGNTQNSYFNTFSKLVIGLIVFVVVYSIILTKGKTINTAFFIIGLGCMYIIKRQLLLPKQGYAANALLKIDYKKYGLIALEILVIALGWYLYQCHQYTTTSDSPPDIDKLYWARVAEYLNSTGMESSYNIYTVFGKYIGTTPYHYFEIWICAAMARTYNLLYFEAYVKMLCPVFLTILSVGIIAMFKMYLKTNVVNLLLPFLLFMYGVNPSFIQPDHFIRFLRPQDVFLINPIEENKLLPYYLIIIFFFLLYKKSLPLAIIILSSLAIISITLSIPVIGGIVLLCSYLFFFDRKTKKSDCYFILSFVAVLALYVFLFYHQTGMKEQDRGSVIGIFSDLKMMATYGIKLSIAKTLDLFYINLVYIGFLIFLFYRRKKALEDGGILLKLLASVYIVSILALGFLYQMTDSYQLFFNIVIPFLHILTIWGLIYFLAEMPKNYFYTIVLFLSVTLLCGYNVYTDRNVRADWSRDKPYSETYLNSVDSAISIPGLNPMGVYFKGGQADYPAYYTTYTLGFPLGNYMKFMKSYFNTVCLTVFDIPINSNDSIYYKGTNIIYNSVKFAITSSLFYKYVEEQKTHNEFISIPQSQLDFIKQYHIQYGIISRHAQLALEINAIISKTIVDSTSGEKFVFFKY